MKNITIYDNGSAYMIQCDGLIVTYKNSLGDAWRHIKWMYEVASQEFTVGMEKIPVKQWIRKMMEIGFLDKEKPYMNEEE